MYLTNVLLNDIRSLLLHYLGRLPTSAQTKNNFPEIWFHFFTSSHLCANKIFKARIMQRTFVRNCWQSRRTRNGQRRAKVEKVHDRISPQNFRQCASATPAYPTEGPRGGRGKENPVAEGCRMNHEDRGLGERSAAAGDDIRQFR